MTAARLLAVTLIALAVLGLTYLRIAEAGGV